MTAWNLLAKITTTTAVNRMKTVRLFAFLTIVLGSVAHVQASITSVCDLLKSPRRYDHKTVIATGFIYADIHSTGIEGEGCAGGIVIRYNVNSVPRGFVNGVEKKRGRLDTRRFKVTVKGKFHAHVSHGQLGYIRRIEVTKVLDWSFADEERPKINPAAATH